jgi:uncharacterized protein YggT (Ycf19 family)
MYTARLILVLIDFIFGLIEIVLAVRILFELLGANSSTPFVSWVYAISGTLLNPFRGIFPSPVLQGKFVLDISAIIALFVYALIAYLISELIRWVSYRSTLYETKTVRRT